MNKKAYTYDYPRPAVTADSVVFCNDSDDAAQARWFPIDSIPSLAFDHEKILAMALEKIKKGKV